MRLFTDGVFTIEHAGSAAIPGYVIVRVETGETSLAELSADRATALIVLLTRTARAIETVVHPDRLYCLSFAEIDRRLHFHLFPRTSWLLEAYWRATGTKDVPINGPVLFEWARTQPPGTIQSPEGTPQVVGVCEALRKELGEHGKT